MWRWGLFFSYIHLTSQDANENLTSSGTQHFDNTAFQCYIDSALNSRKHSVPQKSKNVQFLMTLSRFGHDYRSVLPDSLTLAKVCWIAKATAIITVQFHEWHTLNPILFYAAHFNTEKGEDFVHSVDAHIRKLDLTFLHTVVTHGMKNRVFISKIFKLPISKK